MNIIFYSSTIDKRTKEISRMIEDSSREVGLEMHHSTGSLESRLRQPQNGIALVVLYVSSQKDLFDTIAIQELIIGLPVILIMDTQEKDTVKKARILQPRFIFGADDNLDEIGLVLEKMLARQNSYGQQQDKNGHLKAMNQ